jgi:hypothetical protein
MTKLPIEVRAGVRVRPVKSDDCDGCYFKNNDVGFIVCYCGACSSEYRADGHDVHFIHVGDDDDE